LAKKRKKCPFCGNEVNKENLDRHLLKVHSDLKEEDFEKKGLKTPIGFATKKKTQKEGKKGSRKRKPKKKDRVSAAVSIIAVIVILSLVGTVIYINFSQNEKPNNDKGDNKPVAIMSTTLGTIKIELDTDKAPDTARNFIDLAKSGFYNGIIFHRVIANFMVQGGGFTPDESQKSAGQIPWENTGLRNQRYTIAMARSGDANSEADSGTATSQFFINTVDNPNLDGYSYPYVVFGKVIQGFSVVDAIEALPTGTSNNGMQDWPDDPPVINSILIED
jgi:cyclophilin family peptidyl-prolyl cis-trans isomerase